MRISFISKVTGVHKATTAANDTVYVPSGIFIVFLGFHPGRPASNFPYEQRIRPGNRASPVSGLI